MLIVGLGNPEDKYQNTRHNAGAMLVDFLADKWELKWKKRKDLFCFVAQKDGLFLAKPFEADSLIEKIETLVYTK